MDWELISAMLGGSSDCFYVSECIVCASLRSAGHAIPFFRCINIKCNLAGFWKRSGSTKEIAAMWPERSAGFINREHVWYVLWSNAIKSFFFFFFFFSSYTKSRIWNCIVKAAGGQWRFLRTRATRLSWLNLWSGSLNELLSMGAFSLKAHMVWRVCWSESVLVKTHVNKCQKDPPSFSVLSIKVPCQLHTDIGRSCSSDVSTGCQTFLGKKKLSLHYFDTECKYCFNPFEQRTRAVFFFFLKRKRESQKII